MRLAVTNLSGQRGDDLIFTGISFAVKAGEALTITGPNGAGKSTLLRIIAGLLPASDGQVSFCEADGSTRSVGEAAHYLGAGNAMKPTLSVEENLTFWRDFLGQADCDIDDALDRVGLLGIAHLPYGYLSTGQRRRTAIARLLINWRPIWLLDEPTSGLDKASEANFATLMAEHLARGGMVIAATHLPLGLDNPATIEMRAARHTIYEGSMD